MLRDLWTNARFLAAIPFITIHQLCADYLARQDETLASALNPDEED